jgi:hypothetical protein
MVVTVEGLFGLTGLYDLCELISVTFILYLSLSSLFSQMDYVFLHLCVVWETHKIC